MTNQKALDKYISLQAEILAQLEELKEKIENPEFYPEEINWGHVGDLANINKVLENLINPI